MSKKFKSFKTDLTLSDNKVSFNDAKVGEYAFNKHNSLIGNWVSLDTTKLFSSSDLADAVGMYNISGTYTPLYRDTETLYRIEVTTSLFCLLKHPTYYSGTGSDKSSASFVITGGDDCENETLFNFISKYWEKQ